MKDKKWERPNLVILFRAKREESILSFCKTDFSRDMTGQNDRESGHECTSTRWDLVDETFPHYNCGRCAYLAST